MKLGTAPRSSGFTLVELLVVVGILTILAAIGLPHLLEAQTRAKVSAAKNNLRVLALGLDAYHVDNNHYPCMRPSLPNDPFGLLADHQLTVLTTPVAYISSSSMRDPFGVICQRAYGMSRPTGSSTSETELPIPSVVNSSKSLLYYEYPSFARFAARSDMNCEAAAAVSIGPDMRDSFAVYAPFASGLPPIAYALGLQSGWDCFYDPTNGAVSEGDIPRYVGNLSTPNLP